MNSKEQARLTRLINVENYLVQHTADYATNIAFKAIRAKFGLAKADVDVKSLKTTSKTSGFSQQKLEAKLAMAEEAALYCGNAYVKMEDLNRHDISAQFHINTTDYTSAADPLAATLAQAGHDLMALHLAEITPDFVTAANLTSLQTLITTFVGTKGNSGVAHHASPGDTAAFKESLANADAILDKMQILGRNFVKTNPDFYKYLLLSSKLPPVNVHHSGVQGVSSKAGKPHTASMSLVNTPKVAGTDATGYFIISPVKGGTYTLEASDETGNLISKTVVIPRGDIITVNFEF